MRNSVSFSNKRAVAVLLATVLCAQVLAAQAAGAEYAATYAVGAVPTSIGAGSTVTIEVTVTNTGSAAWNATGASPVHLSYHWYDAGGALVIFDGARTSLVTDVPAGATRTLNAQVVAPPNTGTYQLRFALVKETVTWFDPEPVAHTVNVVPAYAATFGAITLPKLLAGTTATVSVPVTNAGAATWNAAAPNPVNLAYHWLDSQGRLLIWDGVRTSIATDLAPGATRTVAASVEVPQRLGAHTLVFEMVREGDRWFGTAARLATNIETPYRATYVVNTPAPVSATTGDAKAISVTVKNTGDVAWSATGPNPVRLAYHWYDSSGGIVVWDGNRTTISDVAVGGEETVTMTVPTPVNPGTYVLHVDLVREGYAWFSWLGTPTAKVTFQLTRGYSAVYGTHTMDAIVSMGEPFSVKAQVTNTSQRTWAAGGPNPVRLSYHWFDAAGRALVWDGARGVLPKDVAPGETVEVTVPVTAPNVVGTHTFAWDLVHEGVTWFSWQNVTMKRVTVTVPGVIFHGKGWGHGVGMSQWGAQGWATGASGTALTAEQIVGKYYPGTALTPVDPNMEFRILLSSPSTACVGRTITSIAQMRSTGGLEVRDGGDNRLLMTAAPMQTVRVWVQGTTLRVIDESRPTVSIYSGTGAVHVGPNPANPQPIVIDQKSPSSDPSSTDRAIKKLYRGWLRFNVQGFNQLRAVNWVKVDDYTRGAIPAEMPTTTGWHLEAYKSQAYAARTYAAFHKLTPRNAEWEQYDDTKDQCYGGHSVETAATDAATAATAAKVLTYNGAVINAYYSSSNGGSSELNGCVWGVFRSGATWACAGSEPYLTVIQDPADLAAYDNRGPQAHRAWQAIFAPAQLRDAVLAASGVDIGTFVGIDLSNRSPSGRAISVRIRGTAASVDLRADSFLRSTLGLKSTLTRTVPF